MLASSVSVFHGTVSLSAPFYPGVLEPSFTRLLDFLVHVTVVLRAARALLLSSVVHGFVGLTRFSLLVALFVGPPIALIPLPIPEDTAKQGSSRSECGSNYDTCNLAEANSRRIARLTTSGIIFALVVVISLF